jgi:hypothetical protein
MVRFGWSTFVIALSLLVACSSDPSPTTAGGKPSAFGGKSGVKARGGTAGGGLVETTIAEESGGVGGLPQATGGDSAAAGAVAVTPDPSDSGGSSQGAAGSSSSWAGAGIANNLAGTSGLGTLGVAGESATGGTAGAGTVIDGTSGAIGVAGATGERQRLAVIVAVEAEYERVQAEYATPLEQIKAIAAFMSARTEYVHVDIDETVPSVTGQLQNGWIHYVGNNPSLGSLPSPAPPAPGPSALSTQSTQSAWSDQFNPLPPPPPAANPIPASNSARLIDAFENFRGTANVGMIGTIRPMLTNAGWQVDPGASATVEAMRHLAGYGFLYFQGHGGNGQWWNTVGTSEVFHCLQTSELEDDALSNSVYLDDLTNWRLVLITDKTFGKLVNPVTGKYVVNRSTGKEVTEVATWYGITFLWVDLYWKHAFAKDAVVFLNSCHGGRMSSSSSSAFVYSVQTSGSPDHPNSVFAWDGPVNDEAAYSGVNYFLDRVLGSNTFDPEYPAERPFPGDKVLDWMHSKGYDVGNDPNEVFPQGIHLLKFPPGGNGAILAPSIRILEVDEYSGEMKLKGIFGSDQGEVTVGRTPLQVKSWAAEEITATLPPDASGDVRVTVRGLKSNLRPLTEWTVPLRYKSEAVAGRIKFSGSAELRYRLDVSGFRNNPGVEPTYPVRGTWPVLGAGIEVTGSGTVASCALAGGTVTLPTMPAKTTPPTYLLAPLIVDTNAKTGSLGLAIASTAFASPWSLPCTSPPTYFLPAIGGLQRTWSFYQTQAEDDPGSVGPLPAMSVTFGSSMELKDGYFMDVAGGNIEVKWQGATLTNPPRPNDAGI